jgi:HAD superfamily hydrolase (TIGR01662 family)
MSDTLVLEPLKIPKVRPKGGRPQPQVRKQLSDSEQEVVMVVGYPSSGKTTLSQKYLDQQYVHLNRDTEGGTLLELLPKFKTLLAQHRNIVLDNLFPDAQSRRPFIAAAKSAGVNIRCELMATSLEDSQINALQRMWKRYGRLFMTPEDILKFKSKNKNCDPGLFPVAVLFKYRIDFQKPSTLEGFSEIKKIEFSRRYDPTYRNKALILDYDETLRSVAPGSQYKFPTHPSEITLLPHRTKILQDYLSNGWHLFGCSNQSGIARGDVTSEMADICFQETNSQLGVEIDYAYCPHNVPPNCYCRKPQSGMGVYFIEKYKLDTQQCIFVGDQTIDQTFAKRLGFTYADQKDFFAKD